MKKVKYGLIGSVLISTMIVFSLLLCMTASNQLKIDSFARKYTEKEVKSNGELASGYLEASVWNKSKSVKDNTKQLLAEHDIQVQANKFFSTVLSYKSSNEYNTNLQKANKYMTGLGFLKSNTFGTDTVGRINATKLTSKFISVNSYFNNFIESKVNVLLSVKSRYEYGFNTRGTLTTLYVGTYDTVLGKFIAMNYLNQLENDPIENEKA